MYRKTLLQNGIRVVTESISGTRSAAVGVLVEAGARDEAAGREGIAHLVEHLLFQGTSGRDALKIAQLIDGAGGQMGAFTARDYTCLTAGVLDDYVTFILDLLGDLILNSTFEAEAIEREKQTIVREMGLNHDSPARRADALMRGIAWPDHPLGRGVEGYADSLMGVTQRDVLEFVGTQYHAGRLIVTAAGNVDHEDFVAQVNDAFWRLDGRPHASVDRPAKVSSGVVVETSGTSQAYFCLGLNAPPYADASRYETHLFNVLLGGGMSSRLFRRIREERGLVYDIRSDYLAYRDGGVLLIEGCAAPEHLMAVLGTTLLEVCRLATWDDPIDEEELCKAKMQLRGQHLLASENSHTRMSRLATQEHYFGRLVPEGEVLDAIEGIGIKALERLATGPLASSLGGLALAVVGPDDCDESAVRELVDDFRGVTVPSGHEGPGRA